MFQLPFNIGDLSVEILKKSNRLADVWSSFHCGELN